MKDEHYNAPWGKRIRLITGGVGLLGIIAATTLPLVIDDPQNPWVRWLSPAVLLAILGGTSLFSVRGYDLTAEALVVRRSIWTNRIPLATIRSATRDPEACKGAFKLIGNDGLFAMHGLFRSSRLGKFNAFVTDPANAVILELGARKVVISPENPSRFVRELERRLEKLAR